MALIAASCAGCSSSGLAAKPWRVQTVFRRTGWTVSYALPSPNGRYLAFIGSSTLTGPIGDQVMLLQGRSLRQISFSRFSAVDFAWMPDSSALLVAYGPIPGRDRLGEFSLTGRLIREIPVRTPFMCDDAGMAITPDGKTAIISAQPPSWTQQAFHLLRVNLRTGAITRLPGNPIGAFPTILSPGRLAFVGPTGIDRAVLVLDLATGRTHWITPLTQGVDTLGSGHPGGSLVYGLAFDDPEVGIWRTKVDGGAPVQIHSGNELVDPVLMPSGDAVLAVDVGSVGSGTESIVRLTPPP